MKNARKCKMGDCSIDDFGATSIDLYTLQILFEHDIDIDEFFKTAASVALVPLRDDVVASNSEHWAQKTTSIVCNGPFAIKEIEYTKRLRIERNAYYKRNVEENERLDKYVIPWRIVTHYSYGDLEEQYNLFNKNSLFYLGTIPLSKRAEEAKHATVSDELATHTYVFNLNNDLFKDARVRQALSMAIDRNEIVNLVTFARPATGLIPLGVDDANGKGDFRETADKSGVLVNSTADLEGAKKLLKEAKVSGGSFDLSIKDNEQDIAIAEYVAGVWKQLGFKVNVKKVVGTRSKKIEKAFDDNFNIAYQNGDYDVIAIDMNMLTTNAYSELALFATDFAGGGVDMHTKSYDVNGVINGYENKEYNELIEKVFTSTDSAERTALLHEAEAKLIADMPVMPIIFLQDAYLINSKVLSGEKDTILGTRDFSKLKMKNYMSIKEQILAAEAEEQGKTLTD